MRREHAVAALAALAAACTAANPAPQNWQRTMEMAQRSPFGSWVRIEATAGNVAGELIAVEDRVVIVGVGSRLRRISRRHIRKVTVSAYNADAGGVATVAILGTLSTISHGFWLVFTAPLWGLIGGGLTKSASGEGFFSVDGTELADLRPWARFPQGLPAGFAAAKPAPPPVPDVPRGGDGQACYPNATCDSGLECDKATVRCRRPAGLGTAGGRCYANRTCESGLVCTGGTCVPRP